MSATDAGSRPDREARFRAVYEATYPDLVRFVQRRVHPSHAEDIVADAFLVAWRRFDDLPADAADARAWLFGIAQRTLLNGQRVERRRQALTIRIADATVVAQSGETWKGSDSELVARRLDLAAAWGRLTAVHQEALSLAVWDGLDGPQAARVLGIFCGRVPAPAQPGPTGVAPLRRVNPRPVIVSTCRTPGREPVMTPRLHNTEFLDRATNEALRSLDPAGIVDPQLVDNPRAQDTLTRILATDPAAPTTPPPAATGWVRGPARRWLLAGIALVGVGALVIVPGSRHGDPTSTTVPHTYPTLTGNTEFASWTPTSKAVTPAEAAKAGKDCTTKLVRLGVLGPAHPGPGVTVDQPGEAVVVDRRGSWTFVLTEGGVNGDFQAICLYNDNGSGKRVTGQIGRFAAGAVPSNTVVAGIPGKGGIDQNTYSWSTGRVGSDVASVVINTVEKGPVKATVHDGYFAAWWPVPLSVVVATPGPHSPEPTYTVILKDGTIKAAIPQAQIEPQPN